MVKCAVGVAEGFKVEVGLHQSSALSPLEMVLTGLDDDVRG